MSALVFETPEGNMNVGQDGVITATRTFKVYTGNATNRPAWGIVEISINRYDSHPDEPRCLAISVDSQHSSSELGWFDLTYTYTSKPFDENSGDETTDPGGNDTATPPTSRTPTVTFASNSRMVPFLKDYDTPRKNVANSAGQMFEGQEVEDYTQLVTVGFNCSAATNVSSKQSTYLGKVNDDGFAVVPQYGPYEAGCLLCKSWGGSLQFEPEHGWYIAATVEFEYNPNGWQRLYIDRGMFEKKPGAGGYELTKIVSTTTGMPVDAPVYLDGAGRPLGNVPPNVPVELTFYPYKWVSFTNIFA